jgi:hypothetical protein
MRPPAPAFVAAFGCRLLKRPQIHRIIERPATSDDVGRVFSIAAPPNTVNSTDSYIPNRFN